MKTQRIYGLKPKVWKNLIIISIFMAVVIYMGVNAPKKTKEMIHPIPERAYAMLDDVLNPIPSIVPLADAKTQEVSIAIIKKIWRKDWSIGVQIARCESGLKPDNFNGNNTNGTWDAGLFQVNQIHGISKENLMNPYANAGFAYALFTEQGIEPWRSSNHCHKLLK
jgi:hypothetical protein